MAFAETAPLVATLKLDDKFSGPLKKASAGLTAFSTKTARIGAGVKTMGRGFATAFRNIAVLGATALAGLGALLVQSVKDGQDAAKVQVIYANAIANSGKVSAQYVAALNKQQAALMNLAGIDDELIKSEQTRLIQMGLTGEQVLKITPLILDFAKATGIDLLTATKLAGKAVNGNTGALSRYGVMIDKAKAKVDPFAATVDALNSKFGGTTKALSGSLEARLGAFREALANIREEAGMKLLPVLTKIVDVAGKDLVPAFGKFIDRVLPAVISGLDKFASLLENGGAEKGIRAITEALGPMVELLKIASGPVKAIVSAFLSLPSQVQGVLVGAFAVNKLSGGLIGKGIGEVIGGVFARGSSPANPLFVSDVGLGKALTSGAGLLFAPAAITALALASGAAIVVALKESGVIDAIVGKGNELIFGPKRAGEIADFQRDIAPGGRLNNIAFGGDSGGPGLVGNLGRTAMPRNVTRDTTERGLRGQLEHTADLKGILERGIAAGFHPGVLAIQNTFRKNKKHLDDLGKMTLARNALGGLGGGFVVPAPKVEVNVKVNVTAASVTKAITIQQRFGVAGGSRDQSRLQALTG